MLVQNIYRYGPSATPVTYSVALSTTVGHSASVSAVNPAGEVQITAVTTTNAVASTQSNQLIVFGLGLAAGTLTGGQTVNLYDDDGSGGKGTRLDFQLNNQASDLAGNIRWIRCVAIVPSYSSNATRRIRAYTTATAVPTGTQITEADILALAGMGSGGVVIEQTISGTLYSASLSTAMAGGATFSKTGAVDHGDWSSGVIMFERTYSTPFQNGGTAHASGDGMRAEFDVRAWKATTAAVSGGNPILGLFVRCRVRSGHRATATQYAPTSGRVRRATSLTDGTLIQSSDTDVDGNTITYDFTSGWTHWAGAEYVRDVQIGAKQNVIVALGDLTTTTSGTAKTATGQQLYDYWQTTGLVPKYGAGAVYANINHSSYISQLNGTSKILPLQFGGGFIGNIQLAEGGTGERAEQRVVPDWYVAALLKYDANGRRLTFENSTYITTAAYHAHALKYSSTTERYYKQADTYPSGFSNSAGDPWSFDSAHECEQGYVAYLLTGDYQYYHAMNSRASAYRGSATYDGALDNYTVFGDYSRGGQMIDSNGYTTPDAEYLVDWSSNQMRSAAWQYRTISEFGLICADRFSSANLLSWDKSWAQIWNTRHLERCINVINANTGPSSTWNRYGVAGPRWTHTGAEGGMIAPWMLASLTEAVCHAHRIGITNANMVTFLDWIAVHYVATYDAGGSGASLCRDFAFDGYWQRLFDGAETSANRIRTVAAFYERRAKEVPSPPFAGSPSDNTRWWPNGPLTLDAPSGSAITATYPAGLIGSTNASWYINKWLSANAGGRGLIMGVNTGARTFTISTTAANGAAFGATSYAAQEWSLCLPHFDDNPGDTLRAIGYGIGLAQYNYVDKARAAVAMLANSNISTSVSVYNYLRAWKPNADNLGHDMVP